MGLTKTELVTLREAITQAVNSHRDSCPKCRDARDVWTHSHLLCVACSEYVHLDRRLREEQYALMRNACINRAEGGAS